MDHVQGSNNGHYFRSDHNYDPAYMNNVPITTGDSNPYPPYNPFSNNNYPPQEASFLPPHPAESRLIDGKIVTLSF